jgi:hypothetical protein
MVFFLWRIRPLGLICFRINLKLWILHTADRTPWKGRGQPNTNTQLIHIYIDVLIGIRTHDRSAVDYTCTEITMFFYGARRYAWKELQETYKKGTGTLIAAGSNSHNELSAEITLPASA